MMLISREGAALFSFKNLDGISLQSLKVLLKVEIVLIFYIK